MGVVAVDEKSLLERVPTGLLIGGTWRDSSTSASIMVEDPALGAPLVSVADASVEDGVAALDAACDAAAGWARTPSRERSAILRRAFDLVVARTEEFALLITLEMGKPLAESRAEVAYGAEFLRWFAEEAPRIAGRYTVNPVGGTRLVTTKAAVGPCLMITPWNFPLAMATRKVAPAVAAGCTMVVKPAKQTPLTTLLFAQLMTEAGLPDGVLNVITTSATGDVMSRLIRDPRLRKLTFTGSTPVGRNLMEQSAASLLRLSMELGGNAPFLVFDDADLEAAVEGAVAAKMRNTGEACTAANRFFVQRAILSEFTQRLAARLADLAIGRGTEEGVQVGPLIDEKAREDVERRVDEALAAGATIATGGDRLDGPGYFYSPTVVQDVPHAARLLTEETFGPVAPVVAFDDEGEALAYANGSEYGLAAYLYTRSIDRGIRVAESLEVGMVGLNAGVISNAAAPFGGIKASGFGREGGAEGIEEYLYTKYIGLSVTDAP